MDFSYTLYIVLIPLFTFLITGLLGHKIKDSISGLIGTFGLGASAVISYLTAYNYFFKLGKVEGVYKAIIPFNTTWINFTDKLHIDLGVLIDPISVMMLVVITTVSLLVHIYSLGYMKGDKGFSRFFAFLSLFTFSMLGLVIATNIFQMYMFWELVGLSSYLLIGYYYTKPSAVAAAKKAFIVTRFADLGFLIGILFLSYTTGTFDFISLNENASVFAQAAPIGFMGLSVLTWALILIFIGGAGKSAMFPLHIWLPDAMEGPTPVSALIHAATMVVAGVFLVARLFPLFNAVDAIALEIVAIIGGLSSLFAAIIACTQVDIKRVLAFSTMSQIGYMMLALGVSGMGEEGTGFMASMFHLFTHAMFKALLFLGAGSIIHAVHSNNITEMGNLRKYLPITHITFLIACLAIAGIPPFSGFFSKDEILVAAMNHHPIYFWIEWAVAGLTAFYMFRLYFGIFWANDKKYEHAHESPFSMTLPLILLAIATIFVGFIPFNELVTSDGGLLYKHMHWDIALASIAIGLVGIIIAFIFYKKENDWSNKLEKSFGRFYTYALNKFYFDELYIFVTKKIIFKRIATPMAWLDRNVINASVDGIATATNYCSDKIKGMQSGQVQDYLTAMLVSIIVLVFIVIYFII
ncbi:MAG: NADH dehydrogenase [Cryomorphaceae bacterium BACL11 MAG-121001-bin54]|nr:MAG: NADH dehydrogenase [Cryomorphaceae bacterium BACL11 MAG-121001-bin54]KRO65669.1 MAG: NADH dehydrogenase [Cryomorphaceae bacterium BACL11 MAG-121015-bin20]